MTGPPVAAHIEVQNADVLRAKLRVMKDVGLQKELRSANKSAAEIVARQSKVTVPVLTGALQRSIRAGGSQKPGVVRAGGGALEYAKVIHFGWPAHSIAPQPFIYEALDDRRKEVEDAYEKRIAELARTVESR